MNVLLLWLGRIAGMSGALLCVMAAGIRFSGTYWMGGLQVGTLLQGGIAAMTFGCLCLLLLLAKGVDNRR